MSHDGAPKRALVVDDDPAERRRLADTLERSGFAVQEAASGEQALGLIDIHAPSLILIDEQMPLMDGYATCEAIRKLPDHINTAILIVTANVDAVSVEKAYSLGATDLVLKPINWSLLSHRIRYIQRANLIGQGLRESEAKNRAFIQAIPDMVLVFDKSSGRIERVGGRRSKADEWLFENRSFANVDELPENLGAAWAAQFDRLIERRRTQRGEFSRLEGDTRRFYETRMVPFTTNRALIMIRDISEQKQATAKVYQLAYFDTLTGLPNRQSFMTQLSEGIRQAEESGTLLSVLYLDLDNFKRINDSLGHSLGDELLKAVSKRIEKCVRADDYVARYGRSQSNLQLARLGGDEFTLLLSGLKSYDEAETIAQRITESVSKPILQDGHEFVVTPSIGIANYPEDGDDMETLVKNADTAMYHAKESGKNACRMFSGTMSVRSLEHLDLEHSLRRAIANGDLELHYQPKLSLRSGMVTGVEALLRWTHPERGAISPAQFVPIAEEAGLIVDLSDWVLHAACQQVKAWENGPLREVPVAINLSGKLFTKSDVYRGIVNAIKQYSISPSSIDLELTESELMGDIDGTIGTLSKLKHAGLSLYVDDFGTGYSSLSYLTKFPIDALKIDRSFVTDLENVGDNRSVCAAIVAMAHSLNLRVIAEGVETAEHMRVLTHLSCDEVQGYHFCRPISADDVARFIVEHRQRSSLRGSAGQGVA